MNEETYEALKRIVASYYQNKIASDVDIVIIEDWIDEVAKEYSDTKETTRGSAVQN